MPEAAESAPLAEEVLNPPLIAIVGPTASGKSALGIELARRLGGEIVSADSRQMYRHLDAGTAKPRGAWEESSGAERRFVAEGVPHHLVDILEPSEAIDAGRFASLAKGAVAQIESRGKRPILVGGTGLYLRALLEGLDPLPKRDERIRERLAEMADANGRHWLHEELERVDPEAAKRIPANNLQRVVRALEVYELTGKPISSQWTGKPEASGPAPIYLGIAWPRAGLEERIRDRCEDMFPGILDEVRRLVPARFTGREPGFQSLGYPEALRCIAGESTQAQGLASMIRSTVAYAKRQATWFKRQVSVRWIEAGDGDPDAWADAALELVG
ncbi:MAG: tRNA (adenosine(37)-N6)-dimethylallyltransferase MiaA [Elusimicrobia bacterium]|nr:tRNA (adenosine(37)-N6)-dimethylallyltransferase MiaA [Elusimicrobiota bacterium]